jgi:K+-transporting ATPase A subunit
LIMHPGQQIRRALYLRTDGLTFGIFLTVCLIVVTALSYLPSLVLGPVLEHLMFGI